MEDMEMAIVVEWNSSNINIPIPAGDVAFFEHAEWHRTSALRERMMRIFRRHWILRRAI
jgi:hypothetical protein